MFFPLESHISKSTQAASSSVLLKPVPLVKVSHGGLTFAISTKILEAREGVKEEARS